MTSIPTGAPTVATQGPWTQSPLHFDLGVDVLASRSEMGTLPHDWDPGQVQARDHGGAQWPPASPAQLEMLAATMDVPGF
jgi:hypothetical protein